MMIYDCKCEDCQAEFQAVLADEKDTVKCPSCESENVTIKESEIQPGCAGGCSGCSGSSGSCE